MKSKQQILDELSKFISYPTVSNDEKYKQDMMQCASWLANHLEFIGMKKIQIFKTASYPAVYAEYIVDPSFKTILFYGHYDVQPADPLSKWKTHPFKATIKGKYIYGRGSSDDKGQTFIHIKAVEKILNGRKKVPVNIKFLIEGAEEIGSVGLKEFIQQNQKLLACNVVVVSDTKMAAINIPAITYSLRGSLNAEIILKTGNKDLHSGTFGGYTTNAAIIAGKLIYKLHNTDHSIAIPGFYNEVIKTPERERNFIRANGITDKKLLEDAQTFGIWGEKKYSLHERSTIRPSVAVTGITSGFQGKGVKNVIPSIATVKLNFRLVPHQQPEKIALLLNNFLKQIIPNAIYKVTYSSVNKPVVVSKDNGYIRAAIKACEEIFRNKVKLLQNGGTIGAVENLYSILKVPVVLIGFAQASDNMHAPDEKFYLPNFFKGIETSVQFMYNVGAMKNPRLS